MNTKVNIAGVEFKNPVMVASGTFGSGAEYGEFVDLNRLGAVVNKKVLPMCLGKAIYTTYCRNIRGMLNAVGTSESGI